MEDIKMKKALDAKHLRKTSAAVKKKPSKRTTTGTWSLFKRGSRSQEKSWANRIKNAGSKEERKEERRGRKIARNLL